MTPTLSIILPVRSNRRDWWQSIQQIRANNDCSGVEFVSVFDVDDPIGRSITNNTRFGNAGSLYLSGGESNADAIASGIKAASADMIMVIEPGTILHRGVVMRMSQWGIANPDSLCLICGPMLIDTFSNGATHLTDTWQGTSRGMWAQAWETADGRRIGVEKAGPLAKAVPLIGEFDTSDIADTNFIGYADVYRRQGMRMIGMDPNDSFEVSATGTGLMGFRKAAWPGMPAGLRGWAPLAFTIHNRFRKAGGHVMLTGWAKWSAPPDDASTPRPLVGELLRNLLIAMPDEGLDASKILRSVFVDSKKMDGGVFDRIAADPVAYTTAVSRRNQPSTPNPKQDDAGPGTELSAIYAGLGVKEKPGCGGCAAKMRQMDVWGDKGCRDNYNCIVGWMLDGMANFTTMDMIKAAGWAVANGLVFSIGPTMTARAFFEACVTLAIDRSEAKTKKGQAANPEGQPPGQ